MAIRLGVCVLSCVKSKPRLPARHHLAHKVKIFANGNVYLESHDGTLRICEINAFSFTLRHLLDAGLVGLDTRLWIEGMKEPTSRIKECTWLRLPARQDVIAKTKEPPR